IKINDSLYQRGILQPQETSVQIYIAAWRALFRLDDAAIGYRVLCRWYPEWRDPVPEQLSQLNTTIEAVMTALSQTLSHPLGRKIYAVCQARHTPYLLLNDIMKERAGGEFVKTIENPDLLEEAVRKAYNTRLFLLKGKIGRAAVYSTASIFITKILSLVILEVILAKLLQEPLNTFFIAADIAIPTVLMALLISTIKIPSKKNVNLAITQVMGIVYHSETPPSYEIKPSRKPGAFMRTLLAAVYSLGTVVSFSLIFWLLRLLDFPIISTIIDMVFIALVLFTGNAIRSRAQELVIQRKKEGILNILGDMFFLPLASAGQWMSATWKQYNVVALFFSALIDMPFSTFLEFLDSWRHFLKERREELQ
ncbi:MAG: hypothetical protein ACREHG_09780, partial [Candidatus Saccharimonadales bacterium]